MALEEKYPSLLLSVFSFNLVKIHSYFFIKLSWFIASLEAFYFYANLGFQTLINSKSISIFYLLFISYFFMVQLHQMKLLNWQVSCDGGHTLRKHHIFIWW